MRDFTDIERELGLIKFTDSANGTLHCVPAAPDAPRLIVRRFDGELPVAAIPAYASLLEAAHSWVAADPELSAVVDVERPAEVGRDFIARRHFQATSLDAFLETDPEEDPPDPPEELAPMQSRFRERAGAATGPRDLLLTTILARSILDRTGKTFYTYSSEKFVIADLKPTRDELERWRKLAMK
jgi:hypothetical protein